MSEAFGASSGGTPTGFRAAGAGALPTGPGMGGSGDYSPAPPSDPGMGKINVDLTDLAGSIAGGVQSAGSFLGSSGLTSNVDVIGGVPVPKGLPVIGNIIDAIKGAGEAVGGISLPRIQAPSQIGPVSFQYAGNDPTKNQSAAHLGDIPGMMMNVVGAPEHLLESKAAESRLLAAQGKLAFDPVSTMLQALFPALTLEQFAKTGSVSGGPSGSELPPDIKLRLDAGESVGSLADELVSRGAGFSSDAAVNLVTGSALDPMNFMGLGLGRVQDASKLLQTGQELNVVDRSLGTAYNSLTRGMSAAGGATSKVLFGPITSGVVRGIGVPEYVALKRMVTGLNPEYGNRFAEAFGRGEAQMDRAVIGNEMGRDATAQLAQKGENIEAGLTNRLTAQRLANPDQLSRDAEALITRKTPSFLGYSSEELAAESAPKLAAVTGMSLADAERMLQGMDAKTARSIHLAFYGHVGNELETIKTGLQNVPDLNIDVERLTSLAPDTLHDERAKTLVDELTAAGDTPEGTVLADAAVHRYSVLTEAYLGRDYKPNDVQQLVEQLIREDALPTAVRKPTTGKNPLPEELSGWRQRWADSGYDLGFAPEGGWKAIVDKDGVVVASDPFVHFSSDISPVTVRNPLGQFTDSLFRGINQTMILYDSRDRFIQSAFEKGTGISPDQARSVYRAVLDRAADRAVSARGLAWHPQDIEAAFRSVLSDADYAKLRERVDPTWMVMNAFEGNLARVGLTQKLTGRVKTVMTAGGQAPIAALTDAIYPGVKFRYNPLFQGQELVESPFFNIMRGVIGTTVSPEVQTMFNEMMNLPEYKFLQEAGAGLNLAGTAGVQKTMGESTRLGQALSRLPNVATFKRGQQAMQMMYEHGEHFRDAVVRINPDIWRAMTDAYGTTDPRIVSSKYFAERLAFVREGKPTSWRVDDVARQMEEAKPSGFGTQTITRGDPVWDQEAVSQAFQAHWGLGVAESDALGALTEARAQTWATKYNLPASDWYATHLADITRGGTPGDLAQVQGKVVEKITRIVGEDAGTALRLIAPNDEAAQLTRLNRLRRVAANEKVYAPQAGKQTRLTWVNDAGRQVVHYVGGIVDGGKWREMADSTMDDGQIHEAARWYDDFAGAIKQMFPGDDQRVLMGFASTQAAEGVNRGMELVVDAYRAMKAGTLPEERATEMINRAVMAALDGTPPSYKDAPKLSDFFDSFTRKLTRTYVGDDARGLRPAAIDRHTIRDMGFVDPALRNKLKKLTGQDVPLDLKNNGSFNGSQYDFGLNRMNKIADEVNAVPGGWHGRSDWTPSELQAVGWYRVRMATNDVPSGLAEAFDPLTQRISFDLGVTPERGLGRLFPDVSSLPAQARSAITGGVADWARTELAPAVGVGVRKVSTDVGFWKDDVPAQALHFDVVSTERGIDDMANTLGHVLEQNGIIAAQPVTPKQLEEATHVAVLIKGHDPAEAYDALRKVDPELFVGGQVQDGNLEILVDKSRQDEIAAKIDAALGSGTHVEYSPTKAKFYENDWSTTGNDYRQGLHEAGRADLTTGGGLDRLRSSLVSTLDGLYASHAPAELAAHRQGLGEADQAALAAARGTAERGAPVAGHTIEVLPSSETGTSLVAVRNAAGKEVGHLEFSRTADGLTADVVHVTEPSRRQGIGNWMYTEAERQTGLTFRESASQTAEAKALWNQPDRPFGQAFAQETATAGAPGVLRATTTFLADGRAILRAFTNPDVSSGAHELFHIFRRDLRGPDLEAVEKHLGIADGVWTTAAEEQWARWGERFLREGKVDVPALRPVFTQFREWMVNIYRRFKGTPLERQIPPEVRESMNNLFAGAHDPVKGRPPMLADVASSLDPAEVLRIRAKAGLPGDLPFDDYRIGADGTLHTPVPFIDRGARLDAEAAKGVQTLAQTGGARDDRIAELTQEANQLSSNDPANASRLMEIRDEVSRLKGTAQPAAAEVNAAADLSAKWRDLETKNGSRMERELIKLEGQGYDVHDSLDALSDYQGIDRADFTDREEYAQERQDAWDHMLDTIDEVQPLEVEAAADVGPPADAAAVGASTTQDAGLPMPNEGPPSVLAPPQEVPSAGAPQEPIPAPGTPVAPGAALPQPQQPTPAQLRPEGVQGSPELAAAQQRVADAERSFYKTNPTASLAELEKQGKLPEEIALARGQVNELVANAPARLGDPPVPSSGAPATIQGTGPTSIYNPDEEMAWQAFKSSLREEAKISFKTHYFNSQRSWFERTVNHPYLGIYPASYMWGKVLPEFSRFLLMRPFGVRAPLAGMEALSRVQQQVQSAMAQDDSFAHYLTKHPDLMYAFEMILPALPTNMPANFPAYARHISQDLQAGRKVDLNTVSREVGDTASYAFGPTRSLSVAAGALNDALGMGGDLYTELTKSAAIYDGQTQSLGAGPAGLPGSTIHLQQGVNRPSKGSYSGPPVVER